MGRAVIVKGSIGSTGLANDAESKHTKGAEATEKKPNRFFRMNES